MESEKSMPSPEWWARKVVSVPLSYLLIRLNGERNCLNAALVTAHSPLGKTKRRNHDHGAASLAAPAKRQYGCGC